MAFSMIDKTAREKWEKSVEDKIGLPIDLIRRLDTLQMSFYLQNRGKMRISEDGLGRLLFVVNDIKLFRDIYSKVYGIKNPEGNNISGFVFFEDDFDKYLRLIKFR